MHGGSFSDVYSTSLDYVHLTVVSVMMIATIVMIKMMIMIMMITIVYDYDVSQSLPNV